MYLTYNYLVIWFYLIIVDGHIKKIQITEYVSGRIKFGEMLLEFNVPGAFIT